MAQQIYLVRHGETALNADGRLRGLADPDLNDTGRQQALLLAASLIGVTPSVVVSSPLLRVVLLPEELAFAPRHDHRRRCRRRGSGSQLEVEAGRSTTNYQRRAPTRRCRYR